MSIQEASFCLNDFDICVSKLPDSDLKDALKRQTDRMFNLLARETMANRRGIRQPSSVVTAKHSNIQAIAS